MERFANNADSVLNGAINNVTTTIVVADGSPFPSQGDFRLIFGSDADTGEIVIATARSGNTITVLRGQENSTAQSWSDGTIVTHIVTAGAAESLRDTLKGKILHPSLETIGAGQDGFALTWVNADGYWAARQSDPFSTTSDIVFRINSDQKAKIYASGAVVIGDAANNDTSAEAQAGLSGPLITLSSASGTATSTANQALLYNISGSARLQGHSDVRFEVGTNIVGYFDSNRVLRTSINTNPTSNTSMFGTTFPIAGISSLYNISNANNEVTYFSTSASGFTIVEALNSSAGGSSTTGIRLASAGGSAGVTGWDGQGIIEQVGGSTTALVFSKVGGDSFGRATTGRIYQSGAWAIGSGAQNDTSSEAQAGLTGPLLNITQISGGSLTSVANQSLFFNNAGTSTIQGHVGHSFIANTTTVASTSTNKFITHVGKRIATSVKTADYVVTASDHVIIVGSLSTSITITLPSSPTAGDTYIIKDQTGGSATNNIVVSGNGANIDGTSTYTINTNYQSITVVFANGTWSII